MTPYQEGIDAARHWPDFMAIHDCPYIYGSEENIDWRRGYLDGLGPVETVCATCGAKISGTCSLCERSNI